MAEAQQPTNVWTLGIAISSMPALHASRDQALLQGLRDLGYERRQKHRDRTAGDLTLVQPTNFDLSINLKTANQIGVTIPPQVLQRAVKVIN
jgi:hypothetical protein